MKKEQINYFGLTTFRNAKEKFGIKVDDRRRHVYLIGKTGMGKTAMMENMAIQDILNGNGLCFVDPHGDASERLLKFVPKERIEDVIYFNPADQKYPIAFNIMEKVSQDQRHLVVGGLMEVFKKIWPDVWSARMEYILNNSLLALLEYPESTLLGVNRMLSDPEYREKVIEKVTDPVVKSFWIREFARYTERYEVEATAAIQNKIGQFISAPLIRNIIGQIKSNISMREIMDTKKILIVNLSKGKIGEDNSKLLGALIITKLQLAAMSRVDVPEEKREDFYLYVDEFQNFATRSFVNILSEARKYHLALILGHQYIEQMEEEVRDAVFGNIGTLIVFRVGAYDAEYLEKEFEPEFYATDLVNIGKYNIYLRLMINGMASRPFSAETLPPHPDLKEANKEKIIEFCREKYGNPRDTVEEKIYRWTKVSEQEMKHQTRRPSSNSQTLYDAVCADCGKNTKVVFPPDKKRPIYCKNCLKKRQEGKGEERKESPTEGITKSVTLDQAFYSKPIPFSPSRREEEEKKRERKKVNLEELKKVLEKNLKKNETP